MDDELNLPKKNIIYHKKSQKLKQKYKSANTFSSIFNQCLKDEIPESVINYPHSDPHVHTYYSDGCITLEQLVKKAKRNNFPIVMKADHNTTRGNQKLIKLAKKAGILAIPGIEFSTDLGHLVGINVIDWPYKTSNALEIIDHLHDMNAKAVMAHPWWRIGIREKVFSISKLDGYEIYNGASPFGNLYVMRKLYATGKLKKLNIHKLPGFAGSDSHGGILYGNYKTFFLTDDLTIDGILRSIEKKKIIAAGPLLPLLSFTIDGLVNQPKQLQRKLIEK